MEIQITKFTGKNESSETKNYSISNYKTISQSTSLLLVSDGNITNNDGSKDPFFQIKKVQFVASCKTDFNEKELLVAFYVGEYGEMCPYIISELPNNYYQETERFFIL